MPATCSSCGQPIDVHQQVRGGTCNSIACRAIAAKRERARSKAERHAAAAAAVSAHLGTLSGSHPSSDAMALVVVSGSNAQLQPMSPERRENLRSNIAEAFADREPAYNDPPRRELPAAACPPPPDDLAAACATCRGSCCRDGGDSAYLEASTLRRIQAERPTSSPAELVELYMAAVPERSVEHSCIFHGEQGCTLPRELRSHTCNDYFCPSMQDWIGRSAVQSAAMVITGGEQVLRWTIIG